ncbi:MAG: mechanosensitive ion channel [Cyclobacteriaceae bacterium]
MDESNYLNKLSGLTEMAVEFAPTLIKAAATLIIGWIVITIIMKGLSRMFLYRKVDPTVVPFFKSLIGISLKVMLIISVIGILGIEMTSFIAVLGAAGLAVGLALQGTLGNFASGVMILIFKPYKVGDFIEGAGYMGTVREVLLFNTILNTPDNKRIIIPNGSLAGNSLTNFSAEPQRRVDWTFGIAYGDDYDKAKEVLTRYINEDERILKDPEPFIALAALADSSVNIVVRTWVNPDDYWAVFFHMNERVYKEFGKEGLSIPFPQMDVHLNK